MFVYILLTHLFILYFRGRELQRKLADRELEIEMDNRDRQKEKEELEELKAKIYSSDSNNPEFEFAKVRVIYMLSLTRKSVICEDTRICSEKLKDRVLSILL